MDKQVKRYYLLKQKQREIEEELGMLRTELLTACGEMDQPGLEVGNYKVRVTYQERKEYDGQRLFEALPDKALWLHISSADSAKIKSAIKLGALTEEQVSGTYTVKSVKLLHVEKK
ncbi:hypothetical protein ACFO9Q_15650 [Paenibacillus sp. GCM10023252]|uniref:hypothetical protein n=1 Tax=Paenibacillus sp. GCM10023252 TaxID=3252649 RepID=UPI00360E8EBC